MAIKKSRTVLTEHQVIEIYKRKINLEPINSKNIDRFRSASVIAKEFRISEKTVRDIWRGRTWRHATRPLDSAILASFRPKIGRPKGARDKKPRKKREDCIEKSICAHKHCFWCRVFRHNQIQGAGEQSQPHKSVDVEIQSWFDQIPNPDVIPTDPFNQDLQLWLETLRCAESS